MTVLCFDDANRQKDSKFTLLRMSGGRFGINSLAYGLFYYDRDEDGAVRPLIGFQYPNASFGRVLLMPPLFYVETRIIIPLKELAIISQA